MATSIQHDAPTVTIPPIKALWRSLPGRAMSAAAVANGTLWLIFDPDKSDVGAIGDLARHIVVTLVGGEGG